MTFINEAAPAACHDRSRKETCERDSLSSLPDASDSEQPAQGAAVDAARARWQRVKDCQRAARAFDRLCPPPRRDRDTTRTRGILAFYGFGLDEIAAYVNGTSDPDMEAEAERLLHQTDPPVGPPPERAEFVALAEMVAARDALRHRAAQALALSGWDTEDVSAVLRGTADTASTVDAANALSRAGFGFGDTLASLPGLPGLAVAA